MTTKDFLDDDAYIRNQTFLKEVEKSKQQFYRETLLDVKFSRYPYINIKTDSLDDDIKLFREEKGNYNFSRAVYKRRHILSNITKTWFGGTVFIPYSDELVLLTLTNKKEKIDFEKSIIEMNPDNGIGEINLNGKKISINGYYTVNLKSTNNNQRQNYLEIHNNIAYLFTPTYVHPKKFNFENVTVLDWLQK
jgi:hypothetical protein